MPSPAPTITSPSKACRWSAVDRSPAGLNVDVVGVTNEEGARAAVLHLARLGWERIALVGGPLSTNVAVEREQGYRRAFEDAGLPFRPRWWSEPISAKRAAIRQWPTCCTSRRVRRRCSWRTT